MEEEDMYQIFHLHKPLNNFRLFFDITKSGFKSSISADAGLIQL